MAMLLSFAMALRYSFDLGDDADLVEKAAQEVLNTGKRTLDIMTPGCHGGFHRPDGRCGGRRTGQAGRLILRHSVSFERAVAFRLRPVSF